MSSEIESLLPTRQGTDHGATMPATSPGPPPSRGHGHSHGHSHGQHSHAHSHGRATQWVDLHFGALGDDPWAESFREVVFGLNDGIMLSTCIVVGAAALNLFVRVDPWIVRGVGVVAVICSSFSIAARSWLCKLLDNELERDEIQREIRHLEQYPDEEDSEILLSWAHFGLSDETLDAMKRDMRGGGAVRRLRLHAKYELKIDPDRWLDPDTGEITGSTLPSIQPCLVAFATNVVAAFIPVLPWVLFPGYWGVFWLTFLTLVLSTGSLFTLAVLSKEFSGGVRKSCYRQARVASVGLLCAMFGVVVTVAFASELGLVHDRWNNGIVGGGGWR
eukprot:Hpha_TRINITY_DN15550_c6_g14::TRINITY_DN15550_c6_g14_i1::g.104571::m.104571